MALSEDQKAMLRLLAQRGEQGYEDIAALKGLSVDEVRAQVREAVTQLEDEGLPPPALPLDPKPPESAAEEPAKPAPPAPEPPKAEPEPPKAPPPAPEPAAAPAAKPSGPKFSLPSDPGMRGALIAGALVVVALVAVLIISGSDGDSGDTTTAASSPAQEAGSGAQNTASGQSRDLTRAVLSPVDGSDASGVAIFGRLKKSLALQVEARGLEPTAKGQVYAVWLAQSPEKMLPLASTPVDDSGRIGAQFEVPIEVLGYLANETFKQIAITLVEEDALKASLRKATQAKESPEYTGAEILRGTVAGPIVGAAKTGEGD